MFQPDIKELIQVNKLIEEGKEKEAFQVISKLKQRPDFSPKEKLFSFIHITDWHNELKKYCGDIPVVLFANKVDLIEENGLDKDRIQRIVKEKNFLGYFITSAKTGQGVIEAFIALINKLYYKSKS